ncbi:hypothetical protein RF11_06007 [Thelohanellus kitauei]|uniref:Uncharacterized protein n=1 Tax=Thelohanellus kitauei TaxID=669202 RepID=A0A0C2M904_THEKT|nr:hypothetical protein RF11_06007 [Thelohanellus kitauei]
MSKPVQSSPLQIKLPVREISISFEVASTPEELSILKESESQVKMTEPLKYIIQVTNPMTAATFNLPIITIDLQLALDGQEIFTVSRLIAPNSLSPTDCKNELIGSCSPNTFYFSAQQLLPLEVLNFEVELSKTSYTGLLVDKKVSIISAKIVLSHETLEKEIETITVSTKVSGRTKPMNTVYIIAACVSFGVGIILLSILTFISYKVNKQTNSDEIDEKDKGCCIKRIINILK